MLEMHRIMNHDNSQVIFPKQNWVLV